MALLKPPNGYHYLELPIWTVIGRPGWFVRILVCDNCGATVGNISDHNSYHYAQDNDGITVH